MLTNDIYFESLFRRQSFRNAWEAILRALDINIIWFWAAFRMVEFGFVGWWTLCQWDVSRDVIDEHTTVTWCLVVMMLFWTICQVMAIIDYIIQFDSNSSRIWFEKYHAPSHWVNSVLNSMPFRLTNVNQQLESKEIFRPFLTRSVASQCDSMRFVFFARPSKHSKGQSTLKFNEMNLIRKTIM